MTHGTHAGQVHGNFNVARAFLRVRDRELASICQKEMCWLSTREGFALAEVVRVSRRNRGISLVFDAASAQSSARATLGQKDAAPASGV